jgi:two-component system sensor histidine kinase KdpD
MRAVSTEGDGRRRLILAYCGAAGAVAATTAVMFAVRRYLDPGQASLLYLPVVIACSIWFGFGASVFGAILAFLCWDFFFLPPYYTFIVANPRDWLSLVVFLIAAITTARLASQAERRAAEARRRESEITVLYRASEGVSREVVDDRLLAALADEALRTCRASRCVVFRREPSLVPRLGEGRRSGLTELVREEADDAGAFDIDLTARVAEEALKYDQVVGFGSSDELWTKAVAQVTPLPQPLSPPGKGEGRGEKSALTPDPSPEGARSSLGRGEAARKAGERIGAFVPLRAQDRLVGVLYVGPRTDGAPYSAADERLIYVLANHAAVVIARQELASQAAEAKALRQADALKEALVSLVSHELRTPLAAIKATASGLLQEGTNWDAQASQEALRSIDHEADRLSHVVANLLDLSRLEGGAWTPNKDWCDIAEIVGTALDRLRPEEAERVVVTVGENVPLVRADYTQIALVVTNLLENAVKYGVPKTAAVEPRGRIDVTIAPEYNGQDEQPVGAIIAVRDYGDGLFVDEIDQLFTRFYRGRHHRRSGIHGTGLGLALCAAVVQAHGGRIWAQNAPRSEPSGAVFQFTLPIG